MTRDETIKLAEEAGWRVDSEGEILEGDGWHIQTDIVERFAELVAAAEREACAKVCDDMSGPIEIYNPAYVHYIGCAEAIRARGQG
jgi:hypothetical protein